jgi:hypothetical protein
VCFAEVLTPTVRILYRPSTANLQEAPHASPETLAGDAAEPDAAARPGATSAREPELLGTDEDHPV